MSFYFAATLVKVTTIIVLIETIAFGGETVELQQRDVQALPLLGSFKASNVEANVVNLQDSFSGQLIRGRIRLVNTFAVPLRLSKLSSTCGCTTAMASLETIAPGASTDLIVSVSVEKKGAYGIRLSAESNQGALVVQLRGTAVDPLDVRLSDAKYVLASHAFELPVLVRDESISLDALTFQFGDTRVNCTEVDDRRLLIEIPLREGDTGIDGVIAIFHRDASLAPVPIRLVVPGSVELVSKNLLVRNGHFDLVFRGDIESFEPDMAGMLIDGVRYDLSTTKLIRNSTLLVRATSSFNFKENSDVTLLIGKNKFERRLIVSEY